MNQNCSIAINPWWVSHLWLIKKKKLQHTFLSRDFLFGLCHIPAYRQHPVSVCLFAALKSPSQIFGELLLITAFASQVFFFFCCCCFLPLRSYASSFDFASMRDYAAIRKSKHPARFILHRRCFSAGAHCLRQLALRNGVLGLRGLAFIVCWQTIPSGVATLQPHGDNRKTIEKTNRRNELWEAAWLLTPLGGGRGE